MIDEKWSARFRSHDEIRSRGAIGNLNDGIEITTQGVRTRLIAWPGNGPNRERSRADARAGRGKRVLRVRHGG